LGYSAAVWSEAQGLPERRVEALAQTHDGYLWVGTRQGLARFDGLRFTVFTVVNTPAFLSDHCTALAEDRDGTLWVGTTQGLVARRGDGWTRYGKEDGLIEEEVRLLVASRGGGVWVAGRSGLNRWREGRVESWTAKEGLTHERVYCLDEAPDGTLWVGTERGLQTWDPATGRFSEDFGGAEQAWRYGVHGVWAESRDRAWVVWRQADVQELRRYDRGTWTTNRLEGKVELAGHEAWIMPDRRGRLWMSAGRHGLDGFDAGEVSRFTTAEGLSDNWVLSALEDREGNLWIGTDAGLNCWRPWRVRRVTEREGLADRNCWAVVQTRDGALWVGTDRGVTRLTGEGATSFGLENGLARETVRALLEDREGALWVGTGGGGVSVLQAGEFQPRPLPGGLSANKIRALRQRADGSVWAGTEGGLHRYGGERWELCLLGPAGEREDIRALLEDRAGDLWVGTHGGGLVRRRQAGNDVRYTQVDGLSCDVVWALYEGGDGTLWVGTRDGLNWRSGERFYRATVGDGLLESSVNSVIEDRLGQVWWSGDRGVYRLARDDLEAFGAGEAGRVWPGVFGVADGMVTGETNGQKSQPAVWRTEGGRLVYPTPAGLAVFDPEWLQGEVSDPRVVIEQVRAGGGDVLLVGEWRRKEGESDEEMGLPPGSGRLLELHYTACSLTAPEGVRFRYRLAGWEEDWTDAGTRRVAYYTGLRPGRYRFEVEACSAQGRWSERPATLRLSLAPRLHESPAFQGLVALGLGGMGWLWLRTRANTRRCLQRLERQGAVAAERARIARDLHDEAGASLTAAATRLELAKRSVTDPVAAQLTQAQAALMEAQWTMGEIIWSADPRHDTLTATWEYVGRLADELLEPAGVRCRLVQPEWVPRLTLSATLRHDLVLTLKEALHNVVRHAGATAVQVALGVETGQLVLTVEDDGRGLPAESASGGNGLANMRRRVENHGGRFAVTRRGERGTRVRLEIPLPGWPPGDGERPGAGR
jgi:ligand-binding sensor domain-containing protein/signal transduction histidine kinase